MTAKINQSVLKKSLVVQLASVKEQCNNITHELENIPVEYTLDSSLWLLCQLVCSKNLLGTLTFS